jgi:hypothetical protein
MYHDGLEQSKNAVLNSLAAVGCKQKFHHAVNDILGLEDS